MKLEKLVCPSCGAPLVNDFDSNQQIECDNCGSVFIATDLPEDSTVTCPNCRTVNAIEKRYCSSCGESLKIECILCHTKNMVGTIHCVNCGAHLEHARARRTRMQKARRQQQLERLQILQEKEARQKAEKLQRLIDALDEPENHDMALYQLNQLGEEAVTILIETLLNDDDPDARYGSARALRQICNEHDIKGLHKARIVKALIKALPDPEPAVRYWSADALGKCKSQIAIEPLAGLLQDSHDGVRQHAQLALQQIGGERVDKILAGLNKSRGLMGWIKGN